VSETADLIRDHGLIAVVRAPLEDQLFDWAIAVARGGIKLLGIPVGYPHVMEVASDLSDEANLKVGVSGVVTADQVMVAVAAGAHFVISPVCDVEVIRAARARGLAVIAGAATPTELLRCAGAEPDLIAIHPAAGLGGPAYLASLKADFPDLPLAAAGGVDVESAPAYLEAGAIAAIVDRGVFPEAEDPAAAEVITMRALALTEVCSDVLGRERVSMTEILKGAPPV
jgi:2-dehydro-3-deoxyphosphogluconate aldolase/(4S)-4-hydroxy-2-oxoglutarate aldolase